MVPRVAAQKLRAAIGFCRKCEWERQLWRLSHSLTIGLPELLSPAVESLSFSCFRAKEPRRLPCKRTLEGQGQIRVRPVIELPLRSSETFGFGLGRARPLCPEVGRFLPFVSGNHACDFDHHRGEQLVGRSGRWRVRRHPRVGRPIGLSDVLTALLRCSRRISGQLGASATFQK